MSNENDLLVAARDYLGQQSDFLGDLLSEPDAIIAHMPVGVFLADVSDPDCITFSIANPAFQELIGGNCTVNHPYGWHELIDSWNARDLIREIRTSVTSAEICSFDWLQGVQESRRRIGVSLKPVCNTEGVVVGILAILSDRSGDSAKLRESIERAHDDLTGLPNRAALTATLEKFERAARSNKTFDYGILNVNIDRFQTLNDTLGHDGGDEILCLLRDRLLEHIGSDDMLARVNGDEFAVVRCSRSGKVDAWPLAETFQDSVKAPFCVNGDEVFVSLSIGVAYRHGDTQKPMDLIRDADLALYRAKAAGKGRIVLFSEDAHQRTRTMLHLENDLRRAVKYGEFELHYQPIVDIATGDITGFEALCRWNNGEKGAIPPDEFIPLAEAIGLIESLGAWALETACAQLRAWQKKFSHAHPLTMSVNVSGHQLSRHDFVPTVRQALASSGLAGDHLHLEITESTLLETPERAAEVLSQLKRLGVRLVMDDFGTGYSSLAQLNQLPLDTLKIDRAFVHQMNDEAGHKVVQIISLLADALGLDVIAEGVETQSQCDYLKELKCQQAQGFLFAKPMPRAEAEELLSALSQEDSATTAALH